MPRKPRAKPQAEPPVTVAIVSLGCPKNQVDAEVMAGALAQAGFALVGAPEAADAIIVNTCSFIAPAVAEAKGYLEEMSQIKAEGRPRVLICAGCLPQRSGDSLRVEFPAVDAFVGVDAVPEMGRVVARLLEMESGAAEAEIKPPSFLYDHASPRLLSTPPWTAYLKIAEGCLHGCSFCTIPAIRGQYRSRAPESVWQEARDWAGRGVKEVILIAQDTTAYGRDLGASLPDLLRGLSKIEGLHWIRLMYGFPGEITDELLEVMAGAPNICNYIDLPLQHAAPRILKMMRRPGSAEEYLRLIEKIRGRLPGAAIRSAFIVGFPGETEQEFRQLLEFLDAAQLDRVGAFPFCREAGTAAANLPEQLPPDVVQERYERLMSRQQDFSRAQNLAWIGREIEVLVEAADEDEASGRSYRDAPEIDGSVILEAPADAAAAAPGTFVQAEVTAAGEYDLFGRIKEGA